MGKVDEEIVWDTTRSQSDDEATTIVRDWTDEEEKKIVRKSVLCLKT